MLVAEPPVVVLSGLEAVAVSLAALVVLAPATASTKAEGPVVPVLAVVLLGPVDTGGVLVVVVGPVGVPLPAPELAGVLLGAVALVPPPLAGAIVVPLTAPDSDAGGLAPVVAGAVADPVVTPVLGVAVVVVPAVGGALMAAAFEPELGVPAALVSPAVLLGAAAGAFAEVTLAAAPFPEPEVAGAPAAPA